MKFFQLKFGRKMLSSCWDTASSWENSCVTRKGTLVCTIVGGSRVEVLALWWTPGRFQFKNWSEINFNWIGHSMRTIRVSSFGQGIPNVLGHKHGLGKTNQVSPKGRNLSDTVGTPDTCFTCPPLPRNSL